MSADTRILIAGGKPTEDKTLAELTELLRKSIVGAEDMVASWEPEEYIHPDLRATVERAKLVLQELDQNKALQED
jgi:hypothetical protein